MTSPEAAELYRLHARMCQALADPKRLLIINALRDGPRSVGEMATELQLSQPNTSQHLAILKERGIVTARRTGSTIHYSLTGRLVLDALDLLCEFMDSQVEERARVVRGLAHPPAPTAPAQA